jgi:hypothetical protein
MDINEANSTMAQKAKAANCRTREIILKVPIPR